jgi:hypothetical protein
VTPHRPQPLRLDPGQLIAAIPALLRSPPNESVVLIGFTATPAHLTAHCALRLDLPTADDPLAAIAEQVSAAVIAQEVDRVVVVIIADGEPGTDLPHQPMRRALLRAFAEAVWTARIETGTPWRSYLDPGLTGTVPDPADSPVTMAAVLDGEPIYASRADLVAHLAANPSPCWPAAPHGWPRGRPSSPSRRFECCTHCWTRSLPTPTPMAGSTRTRCCGRRTR